MQLLARPGRTLAVAVALVAAVGLTSCGTTTTAQEGARGDYGVVAAPPLPVSAPEVEFDPTTAIANIDGSVVVDVTDGILTFRGPEGSALSATPIPDQAELRAVSADGSQAALYESQGGSSLITVVDDVPQRADETASRVRSFEVDGVIEPEAFSTDGSLLYVIDHQIASVPGAYRVRPLNLSTGELETIMGPTKVPFLEDMNGRGRRQVWSPGGSRLNTLYIRQTHHHHDDSGETHPHGEPGTDGFIHVLDLDEEWAFCLDLPADFGGGDLATTALAVSADGRTLAVADVAAGQVAFASAGDLVVTHTNALPDIDFGRELQLGIANDFLLIGTGTTIQWFDIETMEARSDPIELAAPVVAFTSSNDGVLVWIANDTNGPKVVKPPASDREAARG